MSCAPAGQHRWVWRTRVRLLLSAPEPVLGKNRCSSLAAMPSSGKQRCRQVGLRPPFLPPPPHWLRPARSRKLLTRSRARHLRPVQPPQGASLE
ncbi:hypothetical protein [Xenorhabdus bovienii]|uniref:hypothetical protein n=1 Tax=Xenorhabdus bovienii TaxID=40576 RepID=UPI0023B29B00|nr:hypothetical protein [Xenorhabdus bovienii]MDE9467365.1 hypothetical protein [Xenorhabdus bovienii]